MADVGYVTVVQFQSVAAVRRVWLVCKSIFVQRPIEPVCALISGKDSPRPIPPMSSRSKTDNHEASRCVAETRDSFPPILLAGKSFRFLTRNVLAPLYQTRALAAGNDGGVQ